MGWALTTWQKQFIEFQKIKHNQMLELGTSYFAYMYLDEVWEPLVTRVVWSRSYKQFSLYSTKAYLGGGGECLVEIIHC